VRPLSVVGGAGLYALALPPFDCAWLAWLALVPLLVAVRGRSTGRAFGYGILYGCAFGWTVTGWAAQAATLYFGMSPWLAVAGLSLFYVAVSAPTFGAFAAGAARLLRPGAGAAASVALAALWVAAELVRGRLVGQPWGLLGYTQHAHTGLIQVAALTGVYGVSFVLALGNASLARVVLEPLPQRSLGSALRTLALPAAVVAVVWGSGTILAAEGPAREAAARPVAVIQTNVPPAYRWSRAYTDRQVMAHVRATSRLPDSARPALIVWPENAVPRYLDGEPMLAARLGGVAASHGADLLFGAPRYESGRTYNSVRLITAAGRYGGHYDKQRLVLFAETNPLGGRDGSPSESPRRFSAGDGPGVLQSFVPLGLSICHEVLYPELTARAVRAGAQLLVNVSNDGWLDAGFDAAGRQHFAMAAFRAVETRRYLVRAATTGVSGVVDPHGRVVDALASGAPGVVTVPVAPRGAVTPYVRLGDVFACACVLWAAAALHRRAAVLARRPLVSSTVPAS
jgi:apolipoprotein N-acyltransferase